MLKIRYSHLKTFVIPLVQRFCKPLSAPPVVPLSAPVNLVSKSPLDFKPLVKPPKDCLRMYGTDLKPPFNKLTYAWGARITFARTFATSPRLEFSVAIVFLVVAIAPFVALSIPWLYGPLVPPIYYTIA